MWTDLYARDITSTPPPLPRDTIFWRDVSFMCPLPPSDLCNTVFVSSWLLAPRMCMLLLGVFVVLSVLFVSDCKICLFSKRGTCFLFQSLRKLESIIEIGLKAWPLGLVLTVKHDLKSWPSFALAFIATFESRQCAPRPGLLRPCLFLHDNCIRY